MERKELFSQLIDSLGNEEKASGLRESLGIPGSIDFSDNFTGKVMRRLSESGSMFTTELLRNLGWAFSRVAITGIAAIILLLITLFFTGESISLDSIIGLGDGFNDDLISLLTDK